MLNYFKMLLVILVSTFMAASFAFAHCDFNKDGFDDLALDHGQATVEVLYGSSTGLNGANPQLWQEDNMGLNGLLGFGDRLACGDFNGDGADDLAIGIPFEDLIQTDAGAVQILPDAGTAGAYWFHEGGEQEIEDTFGFSLAP